MSELKERVAALEAGQKHLATTADIAELKAGLMVQIAEVDGQITAVEGQLDMLLWAIPLAAGVVTAIITSLIQFFIPQRKASI